MSNKENLSRRPNRPKLELYVPEPKFRPGDEADFSDIKVPEIGEAKRPPESSAPADIGHLTSQLIRVLDFDGHAKGEWDPKLPAGKLREMMHHMLKVRAFDDRMFRAQRQGKTSFYMKCLGEEATSIAPAMALEPDDMCFPSYRQQGILIARGYPILNMMNQIYSNSADHLLGRQLPIMYSAPEYGFFSVSGNLATQYPQAVGYAMASAASQDSKIAAVWCGEGSTAEGDFHSAMTFAAVYNAPVIMNVVNNQWAISSFHGFAGGERATFAARAAGYGIAGLRVDGNDPLAVYAATQWAADRARSNNGPTLIEHFTYRAEGHSTSDDPSAYRSKNEAAAWPFGDPVERLKQHLILLGEWSEAQHNELADMLMAEVKATQKEAEKNGILGHGMHQPFETMFEDVFEEMPWHLKEQCEQALAEKESKFSTKLKADGKGA
ncbi:3-methyl-2-oxobutanoate dehydrogenase (2-methylpropanoyl-transferring) subunit alpha [Sphingorhabdus lutea]|uniref:2-oxoisovalerate dehydrogenase subunit alpha n=1 Tax=Sphingorhabdus lutea TaxID=1913578 RepID=A0A1L3JBR9_9SPHN|nr:thiamine pyrophosphate-dependent enzyme [Sphingorhabdus lutea]APG62570.1 3-methyl-2-oxobutanoate dehydrogenase (2-methylpropanoyl-transferring) subunit alpha [Sphingorhabdus lutea]